MGRVWNGIPLPAGVNVRQQHEGSQPVVSIKFSHQGRERRALAIPLPTGISVAEKQKQREGISKACAKRLEVLSQIELGTFDYAKSFPESVRIEPAGGSERKMSFFIERMREELKKIKLHDGTFKDYDNALKGYWTETIGDVRACDLAGHHFKDCLSKLDVVAKTVRNKLLPLQLMIADMIEDGELKIDPLATINLKKILDKKKSSEYEVNPFQWAERDRILPAARARNESYECMIDFWWWTGLRSGEMFVLRETDYEPNFIWSGGKGRIHVERVLGKTRKGPWEERIGTKGRKKQKVKARWVFLTPPARKAIDRQLAILRGDGKVVELSPKRENLIWPNPNTGAMYSRPDLFNKSEWTNILEAADVEFRNTYQCRHTYATTMRARGEDDPWIAEQMGHANTEMLVRIYGSRRVDDRGVEGGYRVRNNNWEGAANG